MQHIYTLYIRGGKTGIAQIEVQMKACPVCPQWTEDVKIVKTQGHTMCLRFDEHILMRV